MGYKNNNNNPHLGSDNHIVQLPPGGDLQRGGGIHVPKLDQAAHQAFHLERGFVKFVIICNLFNILI